MPEIRVRVSEKLNKLLKLVTEDWTIHIKGQHNEVYNRGYLKEFEFISKHGTVKGD